MTSARHPSIATRVRRRDLEKVSTRWLEAAMTSDDLETPAQDWWQVSALVDPEADFRHAVTWLRDQLRAVPFLPRDVDRLNDVSAATAWARAVTEARRTA